MIDVLFRISEKKFRIWKKRLNIIAKCFSLNNYIILNLCTNLANASVAVR